MSLIEEDLDFGTEEFSKFLQELAINNNITPIPDLLKWSKDYYKEYINVWPATIANFMGMVINKDSDDEKVIAGWILSFNAVMTSKEKLENEGVPRKAQYEILRALYKEVQTKSQLVSYHVYNHLNKHPTFATLFHNSD